MDKSLKVFLNTLSLILAPSDSDLVAVDHGVNFEQILYDKGISPIPLYLGMNKENKVLLNSLEMQILSSTEQVINELLKQWTASEIYRQYQIANKQQNNKVSATEKAIVSANAILAKPPKSHEWEKDLLNASSIAFIASHNGNKILFLGDSNSTLIVTELDRLGFTKDNQLVVDLVKINHHGSKHNTKKELLERISCDQYLISTDSSDPSYHPARESFILIFEYSREDKNAPLTIFTNYELDLEPLLTAEEQNDLNLSFQGIAYLDFLNK